MHFKWTNEHETYFYDLLNAFKTDTLLRYFDTTKKTFVITDGHKTGLGTILAQGDTLKSSKPVAVASRTTNDSEKHYPQIDLEAISVDFALRRFRKYLIGSPTAVTVITDHKPLLPVLKGKRSGSIRTESIKVNHQDIPYNLHYQKGRQNQSDFLSRYAKQLNLLSPSQQYEAEEQNNLLYMLHSTPVIDRIGLSTIALATNEDDTLQTIRQYVRSGQYWIPKSATKEVQKFRGIMNEITVTGNGILLKGSRMILPKSLQSEAIELAHRGAHPGRSGLARRLRYHFFFHDMSKMIEEYVLKCDHCNVFVDKKTTEPIKHHVIPDQNWDTVAVDLWGQMPSSNHVVVVTDLLSRFPAAKLVKSTKADQVIPALTEIYDTYGNPKVQISDNGPPFDSKRMDAFAENRDIELQKNPPHHPSANPAETFMRPLGKGMKIGAKAGISEKEALKNVLQSYRQTPHPSTGLPPAAMIFRDGYRGNFPRQKVSETDIAAAKLRDKQLKQKNEVTVNSSKYRKQSSLEIGDLVYVRNFNKQRKFEPIFLEVPFVITDINEVGNKLQVKQIHNGTTYWRHPDDLKRHYGDIQPPNHDVQSDQLPYTSIPVSIDESHDDASYFQPPTNQEVQEDQNQIPVEQEIPQLRRSARTPVPNARYYNEEFVVNNIVWV